MSINNVFEIGFGIGCGILFYKIIINIPLIILGIILLIAEIKNR